MYLPFIDLPFADNPVRSPSGAAEALRGWLEQFGYPSEDINGVLAADPVTLTASFHPWICESEFDLASQSYAWMILMDDAGASGFGDDPDLVREFTEANLSAMDGAPAAGSSPSERAFHDIWRRCSLGMSPAWTARARENWCSCLRGFPVEAANRRAGLPMLSAEWLQLRRETGGVKVMLDLTERLRGAEVRDDLFQQLGLAEMISLVQDIIDVVQDILSLAKEKRDGDVNNLIMALRRESGCSEQEALRQAAAMIRSWTDAFLHHEAQIPGLLDSVYASPDDRLNVYRYVDSMRTFVYGVYRWCRSSARYQTP
jgi:hypothetical protein